MLLDLAKVLLKKEYLKHYDKADNFGKYFMDEKIAHSYQVLGAGNYLLKHEESFKYSNKEELDRLRATLLLHDVGRFYEALVGRSGISVDHGIYGAEILANIKEFQDLNIVLPVRHHGHLIHYLLEDESYQTLDLSEKREIDRIISMVMDADKIANFYLLARENEKMEDLFFPKHEAGENNKKASSKVVEEYMKHSLVNRANVTNWADRALLFVACAYDLHYKSSFEFLERLNIMSRILKWIRKYWDEEEAEIYVNEMENFLKDKLQNIQPFEHF